LECANPLQEEAWVVYKIEELMLKGVDLGTVAVLYAQHKQASGIIGMLERKGIPFCAKKPANVLDLPMVRTVINILRYLHLERGRPYSGEGLLFDWMHAPQFGLEPADIAALHLYLQSKDAKDGGYRHARQILDNPFLVSGLKLRNPDAMVRFGNLMADWLHQQAYLPLTLLLEKIIYESGLVARTLNGSNHLWDLQALRTFFDFVKETCTQTPRCAIPDILAILDRMDEEKIALKFEKVFQNEKGVNFYTAHSAKGHEFEYVFLIGCNKNFWEGKPGNNRQFKLPDTLTHSMGTDGASDGEEVARRLFYVALTRAKCHLYVSYSAENNNGDKLPNSVFVDEISEPEERVRPRFDTQDLVRHLEWALQPVPPVQIEIGQRRHIDRILAQFTLSPSTLTQFLRCPIGFYYSCLLRVPVQDAPHFAFGTAVHEALETAFVEMRRADGVWPDKEAVISAFERALWREREGMPDGEYKRRIEQGRKLLSEYYDERLPFLEKSADTEFKVPRYLLHGGIPITGRMDKVERYEDGCVVVDYKTGKVSNAVKKANPPNDAEPLGGDYWRQMVFYKILLENAPERAAHVKYGFFDFVEKDEKTGTYKPQHIPIFDADVEAVETQIYDAWTRIQNQEFDTGCGEEDCYWCNFARRHELVRAPEEASMMDDQS
jgi:DNA helicase-2/ATP-dependent DNA helicase PcrA